MLLTIVISDKNPARLQVPSTGIKSNLNSLIDNQGVFVGAGTFVTFPKWYPGMQTGICYFVGGTTKTIVGNKKAYWRNCFSYVD